MRLCAVLCADLGPFWRAEGRLEHERRQGYTGHDETDAERKAEDKYRVAHQKQEKKGKGKGEGEGKE